MDWAMRDRLAGNGSDHKPSLAEKGLSSCENLLGLFWDQWPLLGCF